MIYGVIPLSIANWTFSSNAGGVIEPSYTILSSNNSLFSNNACAKYDLPAP